jgi:hypothetical protein
MSFHIPASAAVEPELSALDTGDHSGSADSIALAMSPADAFVLLAGSISAEAARRARALHSKADPEVLHKLRVALRRMCSLWWAYWPLLDGKDSELQRGEFKSLANAAGNTHDLECYATCLRLTGRCSTRLPRSSSL